MLLKHKLACQIFFHQWKEGAHIDIQAGKFKIRNRKMSRRMKCVGIPISANIYLCSQTSRENVGKKIFLYFVRFKFLLLLNIEKVGECTCYGVKVWGERTLKNTHNGYLYATRPNTRDIFPRGKSSIILCARSWDFPFIFGGERSRSVSHVVLIFITGEFLKTLGAN